MSIGCFVCEEMFSAADERVKQPVATRMCGHVFHSKCLMEKLSKSKTCPYCRAVIGDIVWEIIRLDFKTIMPADLESIEAKDKEIAEIKEQISEYDSSLVAIQNEWNVLQGNLCDINNAMEKIPVNKSVETVSRIPIHLRWVFAKQERQHGTIPSPTGKKDENPKREVPALLPVSQISSGFNLFKKGSEK